MPWTAIYDEQEVPPHQVPRKVDVQCPVCDDRMRVWPRSSDGKARHFKHIGGMGSGSSSGNSVACDSVAESDEHKVWKSFAADSLLEAFEDNIQRWEGFDQEQKRELVTENGVSAPTSEKNWRVGDIVMAFDEQDPQLGEGIIIEVQHKNESKDIDATSADYIQQGYSVVWLYEDDFGSDRCLLGEVDFRRRAREAAWPDHVPERNRWWEPQYNHSKQQSNWRDALQSGLAVSGAPATLPTEWVDETSLSIWREQDWMQLFPEYVDDFGQHITSRYESAEYFDEVRHSCDPVPDFEVILPPEWFDSAAQDIWTNTEWNQIFPDTMSDGTSRYKQQEFISNEISLNQHSVSLEIDVAPFLGREFWRRNWMKGNSKADGSLALVCDECSDVINSKGHKENVAKLFKFHVKRNHKSKLKRYNSYKNPYLKFLDRKHIARLEGSGTPIIRQLK